MSNLDQLNKDIETLPQVAQQLIFDFVDFLKHRYSPILPDVPTPIQPIDFDNEPFVGMWSDRLDMQDSTAWVRQIREQHWQK